MHKFYLLLLSFCCFVSSLQAQSYVYFQNNSSLEFSVNSIQTGPHTMESDEWWGMNNETIIPWQLNTNVLWTNRDAGIHNGTDFFLTTTLKSGLDSINLKLRLNGNFIGSDIWHSADGPGFSNPWYDDRDFHEETFMLNGKLVTLKYTAYFTGGYDDYLFVLQEHEPFPNLATDLTDANVLNILTYNIYMLTPPISLTDQSTRATYLHKAVQGYDAIIINEAFDNAARSILTDSLSLEYPYLTPVVDEAGSTEDGGVLIYSRWPILYNESIVYTDCDGSDCLAAKGAMYAQIDKLGRTYHIFGTHLQAFADPQNIVTRQSQLTQLKAFVDSKNIPSTEAVILGGDFNVEKIANASNEYDIMLNILNAEEPDYLGYPLTYDYLVSSYVSPTSQEYLDYVFYAKDYLVPTIQTNEPLIYRSIEDEMWDIFDLSDHLAVRGRFEFPTTACIADLVLNSNYTVENLTFQASNSINSIDTISGTATINYQAGNCIELQAGFEVNLGAEFEATIQGCSQP